MAVPIEADWESRAERVILSTPEIEELLSPVLGRELRVSSAAILETGHANTTYRVLLQGSDESLILRLFVRDPTACGRELELFELVRRSVPTPEVLHADPEGSLGGRPYFVSRFVAGTLLSELLASAGEEEAAELGGVVGRTLASIHRHAFPAHGFFGRSATVSQPVKSFSEAAVLEIERNLFDLKAEQRLGGDLRDRAWALVEGSREVFQSLDTAPVLVHGDFKPPNLLMQYSSQGYRTAAVFDWEFALAGPCLFDACTMLRGLWMEPGPFALSFVESYTDAGGALPEDWRRAVALVDLVAMSQFLAQPGERPNLHRDVVTLTTKTVHTYS